VLGVWYCESWGIGEIEKLKADSTTQRCFLQVLLESPRCDFI